MKYSTTFALIIVGLVAFQSLRAETTVISDDLQLRVIFTGKASPTSGPDGYMDCYLTDLTTNRAITIVYEPEVSYYYKAELFDKNGVAVPKREPSQTIGSHFADLDPEVGLKESRVNFEHSSEFMHYGGEVHLLYNGNEIIAHKKSFSYGDARCSTQPLHLELFNISSAGEYRLRLTFQIFELIGNEGIKLVRFPPVEDTITVTPEDLKAEKTRAINEGVRSSVLTSASVQSQAVPPLQPKSTKVLNTPHPTLAFAGYNSPDSALESWLWACFQGDKTTMLQSLTPEEQEDYKHAFDGKTDAQIKDAAAKISAQFSGYTVQKMEIVSDIEVILNYTFAGSDQVQKMVVKKIGNEWKVAGPSQDSAVTSISVPSQRDRVKGE
jgi:hypothetical protein